MYVVHREATRGSLLLPPETGPWNPFPSRGAPLSGANKSSQPHTLPFRAQDSNRPNGLNLRTIGSN